MKEKEKKAHGIQLLLRCVVRDPDGKIISDTGQKPAKSFVIQFLEFIYFVLESGIYEDATATNNTEQMIYRFDVAMNGQFLINGAVGDASKGIRVGTGDTAVTNTDYNLEAGIASGAGAGQLTYGAQVVGTAAVVGANVDLELKRAFTNNSGSAITVKEAGMNVRYSTAYQFLIVRDVLGAPVEIPDKCSLTVYYTFRTTV